MSSDVRKRDPEATRVAILEAAEAVFIERGFGDASISEIASQAAVTKSLIHHYFGSKQGLWDQVKEARFNEYATQQKRMLLESDGTAGLLKQSVITYFEFLRRNPDFVRLLCWVQLEDCDRHAFKFSEGLKALGLDRIREAQEQGELRSDVDPFSMLVSFIGLSQHWFQSREMHLGSAEGEYSTDWQDKRYLEEMLKIFFEGVLPRQPPAS